MDNSIVISQKLEKTAINLINTEYPDQIPDELLIRKQLDIARRIYNVSDEEYGRIFRSIRTKMQFEMNQGVVIKDAESYKPWLHTRRSKIDFFYWERYKAYLLGEKSWNTKVVGTLNKITDEILDFLGNPVNPETWQRRGLIMGDVQSGKTAAYTALCNKAMDAGYKVIIILTGTQENLRRQTQERLDVELVGIESERFLDKLEKKWIYKGVGKIDGRHFVATFTSKNNDFDQGLLNTLNLRLKNYAEPVLFVVKKQKTRLDYLERWLRKFNAESDGFIDMPVLIIDDESDNASINTSGDENNPTVINRSIRRLLTMFKRSSYVGITATPYANIFIDPESNSEMLEDDLFPRDFIYSLTPPNNYIGANSIFGENARFINVIQHFDDAEDIIPLKHPKNFDLNTLPGSLYKAICYFLLTNVVRDTRGDIFSHRSMLINISRFTLIHHKIAELVQDWLDKLISDVRNYGNLDTAKASRIPSIIMLRNIWEESGFEKFGAPRWEEVQSKHLYNAIASIKVFEVNQRTGAAILDYEKYKDGGLRVIAVGGNSLSRGITLEGLCVSYFYRNSKMYDTLLQMGRWFGFRDNYHDVCRIYMSEEADDSFSHITMATNELRDEIAIMNRNNMTPEEFGLMVRASPSNIDTMVGKLIVTAPNKMRYTSEIIHMVSVSGELIETPRIPCNVAHIGTNFTNVKSFLAFINSSHRQISELDIGIYHRKSPLWTDVPSSEISDMVRLFINDPADLKFDARSLAEYIKNAKHLSRWDVVIPTGDASPIKILDGVNIVPQQRSADIKNNVIRINKKNLRVGSRGSTRFGLSPKDVKRIEDDMANPPDKAYLIKGRKPLLIIHFIEIKSDGDVDLLKLSSELAKSNIFLVALGLGFPMSQKDETRLVRYVINAVKQKQLSLFHVEETEDED